MVKDRYDNGVETYARRALMLARIDYERGYLTRSEYGRVVDALQDVVIQYEISKRRQEKTPKA